MLWEYIYVSWLLCRKKVKPSNSPVPEIEKIRIY